MASPGEARASVLQPADLALLEQFAAEAARVMQRLWQLGHLKEKARQLESLLWEVYRHNSNYKLQGIALWAGVAAMEMALLELAKAAGWAATLETLDAERAGQGRVAP